MTASALSVIYLYCLCCLGQLDAAHQARARLAQSHTLPCPFSFSALACTRPLLSASCCFPSPVNKILPAPQLLSLAQHAHHGSHSCFLKGGSPAGQAGSMPSMQRSPVSASVPALLSARIASSLWCVGCLTQAGKLRNQLLLRLFLDLSRSNRRAGGDVWGGWGVARAAEPRATTPKKGRLESRPAPTHRPQQPSAQTAWPAGQGWQGMGGSTGRGWQADARTQAKAQAASQPAHPQPANQPTFSLSLRCS